MTFNKGLLFFILELFFLVACSASGSNCAWTIGGVDLENFYFVTITSDNAYLLMGKIIWSDSDSESIWLLKLNNHGQVVWERTYPIDVGHDLVEIRKLYDGGYLAAGTVKAQDGEKSDIWVLRLDEKGDRLWQRIYSSADSFAVTAIQIDPAGAYLLTGLSQASNSKNSNAWIMKFDESGKLLWHKIYYEKIDNELVFSLGILPGLGYLLVGGKQSSEIVLDEDEGLYGSNACLLMVDLNGDILWEKTYPGFGPGFNMAGAILCQESGGFILAGNDYWFLSDDEWGMDAWLGTYDVQGEQVWRTSFTGNGWYFLVFIETDSEGNYLAGGTFLDFGDYNQYGWLAKVNADGNIVWDRKYGCNRATYLNSVVENSQGGYLAVGYCEPELFDFYDTSNADGFYISLDHNGNCIAPCPTSSNAF